MTTTIVGVDGTIATIVARHLDAGGEPLVLVGRELATAQLVADALGDNVTAATLEDAIDRSGTVIFATWFSVTEELLAGHRSALGGKVVMDASNPITPPDDNGRFTKVIGANESAGQILAGLAPSASAFVKAFGTLSAASLARSARDDPRRVLFFAADNAAGAAEAERLITTAGFAPISVGGIDQSIRIEVGGDLHEYGGLGKPVTAQQAHAALVS